MCIYRHTNTLTEIDMNIYVQYMLIEIDVNIYMFKYTLAEIDMNMYVHIDAYIDRYEHV